MAIEIQEFLEAGRANYVRQKSEGYSIKIKYFEITSKPGTKQGKPCQAFKFAPVGCMQLRLAHKVCYYKNEYLGTRNDLQNSTMITGSG